MCARVSGYTRAGVRLARLNASRMRNENVNDSFVSRMSRPRANSGLSILQQQRVSQDSRKTENEKDRDGKASKEKGGS